MRHHDPQRAMLQRDGGRRVAASVALVLSMVVSLAGTPAHASDTDPCSLLTKREASKVLGAKVVKLRRETDAASSVATCTYRTKVYKEERLRKFKGSYSLAIIWSPLTDTVRTGIDDNRADLDPISGVGDEAYASNGDVFAFVGTDVIQASVLNWQTGASSLRARAERAVRLAVARLSAG